MDTQKQSYPQESDEYLKQLTHDLRSPMTAIKGIVSMMMDGDYGPVSKNLEEPLADIKTSVEKLITLVNTPPTLPKEN